MKASNAEFRYRWFIFSAIFFVSFSLYWTRDDNLTHALLTALARREGAAWSSEGAYRLVFALGALAVFVGGMVRSWAAAYLQSSVVHDQRLHAGRLVADGPYRHVRNPLYLGTILLAVGFAPMASRVGALVMIVAGVLFPLRLIGREESELLAAQGESYRAYLQAVPRLLPSLWPRVPASGARPAWSQGVAGEAMMWAFFLGMALFAATLSFKLFGAGIVAGLCASMIVNLLVARKAKTAAAATK